MLRPEWSPGLAFASAPATRGMVEGAVASVSSATLDTRPALTHAQTQQSAAADMRTMLQAVQDQEVAYAHVFPTTQEPNVPPVPLGTPGPRARRIAPTLQCRVTITVPPAAPYPVPVYVKRTIACPAAVRAAPGSTRILSVTLTIA